MEIVKVNIEEYCRILQEYSQKEILKREILKILKRSQEKSLYEAICRTQNEMY